MGSWGDPREGGELEFTATYQPIRGHFKILPRYSSEYEVHISFKFSNIEAPKCYRGPPGSELCRWESAGLFSPSVPSLNNRRAQIWSLILKQEVGY